MEAIKHALAYQWQGAAVWVWLVTLVVLPVLNEIVQRSRKVTAGSLLQAVGNAIKGSPLYKLPLVKQLADVLGTPAMPTILPPDEPAELHVGQSK